MYVIDLIFPLSLGIPGQQTMTRDFTCSVSEFMSSTGSIHVYSPDSVNKFGVFTVKSRVFHVMTRTIETVPVLTQYDSFKTRDNRQNTCIHMNTHESMYWWSGTNYEPV